MLGEQLKAALLLVRVAKDADEDDGGFQIAGDIHVVDGDQARVADVKFAADGLADFALEQFAHTLESEAGHFLFVKLLNRESLNRRTVSTMQRFTNQRVS
jgi:hypothetical protein